MVYTASVFGKHKFLIPLYMLIIRYFVRHTDPFHPYCLMVLSRVFLVTFWGAVWGLGTLPSHTDCPGEPRLYAHDVLQKTIVPPAPLRTVQRPHYRQGNELILFWCFMPE